MPRTTLNDFSETPTENSDIGGVSILGTNKPSNLDDAERAFAAIVAKAVNGTTPVNATWKWRHPDQTTRTFEIDPENIPNATHRVIDAEALFDLADDAAGIIAGIARRGAPTVTAYTASGTHTFAEGTAYYQIVAVGCGGGSGAVDGQGPNTGGCSAGANSGFFGRTTILPKGALTTGAIVIGAAGLAGAVPNGNGGDGEDVTWNDATVGTLTWKGGKGSVGITGGSNRSFGLPLANDASSGAISGSYNIGGPGNTNSVSVAGGIGACSPWGGGGLPTLAFDAAIAGVSGNGYGSGASGAASHGVGTNAAGAAGTGGRLEVWEW